MSIGLELVPGHTQGRKASMLAFKIECPHNIGTCAQKSPGLVYILSLLLSDCIQNMNFSFGHLNLFPHLKFLSTIVANWTILISMNFYRERRSAKLATVTLACDKHSALLTDTSSIALPFPYSGTYL